MKLVLTIGKALFTEHHSKTMKEEKDKIIEDLTSKIEELEITIKEKDTEIENSAGTIVDFKDALLEIKYIAKNHV